MPLLLSVWLLIKEKWTLNVSCLNESLKDACVSTLFSVSTGEKSVDELQEKEKQGKISSQTQPGPKIQRISKFCCQKTKYTDVYCFHTVPKGKPWMWACLPATHLFPKRSFCILYMICHIFPKAAVWQTANKSRALQKACIMYWACLGRLSINLEKLAWICICQRRNIN